MKTIKDYKYKNEILTQKVEYLNKYIEEQHEYIENLKKDKYNLSCDSSKIKFLEIEIQKMKDLISFINIIIHDETVKPLDVRLKIDTLIKGFEKDSLKF